jgi:hypothetical protein
MITRLIFIIFICFAGILSHSCKSKTKNDPASEDVNKKSEEKRFLKVVISSSKIRSTPDLEGAVLERAKEDFVLEYLEDSTNFTSSVRIGGENVESRWYKVKSRRGNEGWISAICVRFLTDEENRQLISLTEDEALSDKKEAKSRTQKESKIDSLLLKTFRARLVSLNAVDSKTFPIAVSIFESIFQQKPSATADLAFADLMLLHEKVFKIQQAKVNAAAYQYLAEEIKNYGSTNLDINVKGDELVENYIGFGLNKRGRVYLKQNYDQLMRKFLRLIGPPMQNYLEQCALESDSPPLEDGQISVPLTEIAAHAVFWDKYLSRFPYSAVKTVAAEKRRYYTNILLEGAANKNAFSEGKLNPTFKESYLAMTTQMGVSPLIKSFKEYYLLLESGKFKETKKTKDFVQKIQAGL